MEDSILNNLVDKKFTLIALEKVFWSINTSKQYEHKAIKVLNCDTQRPKKELPLLQYHKAAPKINMFAVVSIKQQI